MQEIQHDAWFLPANTTRRPSYLGHNDIRLALTPDEDLFFTADIYEDSPFQPVKKVCSLCYGDLCCVRFLRSFLSAQLYSTRRFDKLTIAKHIFCLPVPFFCLNGKTNRIEASEDAPVRRSVAPVWCSHMCRALGAICSRLMNFVLCVQDVCMMVLLTNTIGALRREVHRSTVAETCKKVSLLFIQ